MARVLCFGVWKCTWLNFRLQLLGLLALESFDFWVTWHWHWDSGFLIVVVGCIVISMPHMPLYVQRTNSQFAVSSPQSAVLSPWARDISSNNKWTLVAGRVPKALRHPTELWIVIVFFFYFYMYVVPSLKTFHFCLRFMLSLFHRGVPCPAAHIYCRLCELYTFMHDAQLLEYDHNYARTSPQLPGVHFLIRGLVTRNFWVAHCLPFEGFSSKFLKPHRFWCLRPHMLRLAYWPANFGLLPFGDLLIFNWNYIV